MSSLRLRVNPGSLSTLEGRKTLQGSSHLENGRHPRYVRESKPG